MSHYHLLVTEEKVEFGEGDVDAVAVGEGKHCVTERLCEVVT